MNFPFPLNNQRGQIIDNASVRFSILEIASATGALCALAGDPLFPSGDTTSPVEVPGPIGASLLNISVEVIEKLLEICEQLDLVLSRCILKKLGINDSKYPAALCKVRSVVIQLPVNLTVVLLFIRFTSYLFHFCIQGSMDKCTTYKAETGVTKGNQSICLDEVSASLDFGRGQENRNIADSVIPITAYLVEFVRVRDWTKFDTPRNLVLAMLGEVGELAEIMQWKGDFKEHDKIKNDKVINKLSQEISDVAIYLLRVVWVCNLTDNLRQQLSER